MQIPEAARYFFNLGIPVLPFKLIPEAGKKPKRQPLVHEWTHWQTMPQTLQEFLALRWSERDGWFVV